MTSAEVQQLKQARESMTRRRGDLAKLIGQSPLVSVESAEELTKIQHAIEAVDRALADAGQPYLSPGFAGPPEA